MPPTLEELKTCSTWLTEKLRNPKVFVDGHIGWGTSGGVEWWGGILGGGDIGEGRGVRYLKGPLQVYPINTRKRHSGLGCSQKDLWVLKFLKFFKFLKSGKLKSLPRSSHAPGWISGF
jgi:hypothetical protein